jgi:DNA-binding transcriptional LysR family regulator
MRGKNLTRAAVREGIAASAVSKRMNDFEAAFEISLFERLSKGMALTPAGEALLHHARVTLLNVEKIAVELAEYGKGVRGHVRMLANLSAIVQFLPEDLSGFFSAHGLLRVDLQERPSGQVVRGIEEGAAEIGICSAETETRRLQTFHYRYDNLVVVRPDHPLAAADWARRQLKIAVRDSRQLLGTGRLMFGHLQAAEGREAPSLA